jgi:hypothetical protein
VSRRALQLAKNLTLPIDAVTQTFAIFGKRGSGKTNGATVLVEELLRANLNVVVLDPVDAWWGLKSSFDGKKPGLPIYVFGGPHGDLPLESTAGALIADLVVKERLPLVLSMKSWGVAERARFVTEFAKQMLKTNSEPVMVVLEEADAFIPQRPAKGEEAMLGEMDRMVRWGRSSGIGCTLITQRSAKVNKDVTTQAETLIAFRTTGPQDRDAIDNWIKFHAGEDRRDELLSTLPSLPTGTAWVWSPEWLEVFDRYEFRRRSTYDSGATPKVGEKRPAPKQLAAVDLERLRGQMAETIERAKADDPRELRRQLAEANKRIAEAQKGITRSNTPAVKPPKVVEKFVLKDGQLARAEALVERIDLLSDKFSGYEEDLRIVAKEIRDAITKTRQSIPPEPPTPQPVHRHSARQAGAGSPGGSRDRARPAAEGITEPQQRILDVVAMLHRRGIPPDRECVAAWLDLHPRGGSYGENLGALRAQGYLDGWQLTPQGVAAARELPTGVDAAVEPLTEPQRRILQLVISRNGVVYNRDSAAEALGLHPRGGSYGENIGRLRTMGLLEPRGDFKATEALFR